MHPKSLYREEIPLKGPDFDRLLKVLYLEAEPDRVPFFEHFADREIMEAVTGEQMTKMDQSKPSERERA